MQGRYEILGCLAHGGVGWIYLARDVNLGDTVSERLVVLKGLIDTDNPDAAAAAVNERRFLVEVDHPNIVKVHDFVRHPDPRTGTMVGYIVMEYLDGLSLHTLYRQHRDDFGRRAPLPLHTVLGYGIEVLEAFGYLHEKVLVYCDLKPDNIMHVGRQVKLIDLGAVRRIGDRFAAVFSTSGFQAPEVDRPNDPEIPSVTSDVYAVGRTLAVLSLPFAGFTTEFRHRLPDDDPLFVKEESFHRLLLRATHPDPARRFESARAMREQVQGVLAEVAADLDGEPRAPLSVHFTPERRAFGTDVGGHVDWTVLPRVLPVPLPDLSDPNAARLATLHAATAKLGRAVQLAQESGRNDTLAVLSRLVDVVDAPSGTVRVRPTMAAVDAELASLQSRKTVPVLPADERRGPPPTMAAVDAELASARSRKTVRVRPAEEGRDL